MYYMDFLKGNLERLSPSLWCCESKFLGKLNYLLVAEVYSTSEDCMREAADGSIPRTENSHKISVPW